MRWKSYRIIELPKEQQTETLFDTLQLIDSGYVASYNLNNDYISNENSTVKFVGSTTTRSGDLIALIRDSIEIFSGVVVSVDNEQHEMTVNSLLTLFDTTVLNPYRADKEGVGVIRAYKPIDELVKQLKLAFADKSIDRRRRLPLYITTSGATSGDVWVNNDNAINLLEFILQLFDKFNIVVQTSIVFESVLSYIRVRIFVNTKSQDVIKINVASMSITHSEVVQPTATVCEIIAKPYEIKWSVKGKDNDGKDISIPMVIALDGGKQHLDYYYLNIDGTVTNNANDPKRFELYKLVVEEYQLNIDSGEKEPADNSEANDPNKPNTGKPIFIPNNKTTQLEVAENALQYNEFNHYVTITTRKDNKMIANIEIGDRVWIVHKVFQVDTSDNDYTDDSDTQEKYILSSIYTGRQENSDSDTVTLVFGKIRTNYTEIKGK